MNTTNAKASFIRTGLSQIIASIHQRQSGNGTLGRRLSKFRLICRSAIVILTWSGFSALGTVWQSDGTSQSVQYLHDNSAHDGDTITLPAGTFVWTSGIRVTKAITLQGAGVGITIVKDDVQTPAQLIYWDLRSVSNGAARITGIDFRDGGRQSQANGPDGILHIDAYNNNGTTFRFDHNA